MGNEKAPAASCCGVSSPGDSIPSNPCEDGDCHCADNPADLPSVHLAIPAPLPFEFFPLPGYAGEFRLAFPAQEKLIPDVVFRHPPPLNETSILFQVFRI